MFQEEQEDPEFASLLKRMKVVDDKNESAMDEDQWDAASMLFLIGRRGTCSPIIPLPDIYLAFAFEKTSNDLP
jgi:hypothetical protein